MQNKILAVAVIALLAGCLECSSQSADDAQKVLDQYLESQSGNEIKVDTFKKTDGQKNELMGVEGYNLFYEADVVFASDGFWEAHMYGQPLTFNFSKTSVGFGQMNGQTKVHLGDRVKIGGVMVGQKRESGWLFDVGDCHIISGPTAGAAIPSNNNPNTTPTVSQPTPNNSTTEQQAFDRFAQRFNLTDEQKPKVKAILDERNLKIKAIQDDTKAKMKDVLTDEQFDQWEKTSSPNRPASSGNSDFSTMSRDEIIAKVKNDLRQIDGAKNEFALEHGKTTGDPCTEADIKSYLAEGVLVHPPGGHFIINSIGTPPESSTYGKFGSF